MKKKVLPISLNEKQVQFLKGMSFCRDVSMAQIIRELINKEIKGDSNEGNL